MNKRYSNFFDDDIAKKPFSEVLNEVQEYISSKFSTLISDNPEEQKKQICAYIAKYITDYQISVDGIFPIIGNHRKRGLSRHGYIKYVTHF